MAEKGQVAARRRWPKAQGTAGGFAGSWYSPSSGNRTSALGISSTARRPRLPRSPQTKGGFRGAVCIYLKVNILTNAIWGEGGQWGASNGRPAAPKREARQKPKVWKGSVCQVVWKVTRVPHAARGTGRPAARRGLTAGPACGKAGPRAEPACPACESHRSVPVGPQLCTVHFRAAEASALDATGDSPVGAESTHTAKHAPSDRSTRGPSGANPKLFHHKMSIFLSAGRECVAGEGPGRLCRRGSRWRPGDHPAPFPRDRGRRGAWFTPTPGVP